MKGLICGIKRMEIHDGEGLRTTVFFKGCPLRCIWCHNPESMAFGKQIAFFQSRCIGCGTCKGERTEEAAVRCPTEAIYLYGSEYELDGLVELLMQDEAFFQNGGGVTLSGGECLAQPEFAIALARRLREMGVSVYVDTCGHVKREILEQIIPFTDKFLYDVKAADAKVHERCTGRDNRLILENLRFLVERGCRIEIRYPLIKGYNDGECEQIARLLGALGGIEKVKVLQYHALAASRYEALGMVNTLPRVQTTFDDVENAVRILGAHGLHALNGMLED